jgi:hypothetical protein
MIDLCMTNGGKALIFCFIIIPPSNAKKERYHFDGCEWVFFGLAEMPEVGGQLGYQLTLFGPRGAYYARHITTGPPIFLEDAASLSGV